VEIRDRMAGLVRTPGNGWGGLILKRHLLSGQTPCQFVRIAPGQWPPRDFPKNIVRTSISGLFFAKKTSRIRRIWGKITADKCMYLKKNDFCPDRGPGCFKKN
jgi:hypothetical protein